LTTTYSIFNNLVLQHRNQYSDEKYFSFYLEVMSHNNEFKIIVSGKWVLPVSCICWNRRRLDKLLSSLLPTGLYDPNPAPERVLNWVYSLKSQGSGSLYGFKQNQNWCSITHYECTIFL